MDTEDPDKFSIPIVFPDGERDVVVLDVSDLVAMPIPRQLRTALFRQRVEVIMEERLSKWQEEHGR
jgi:hypothetical protein